MYKRIRWLVSSAVLTVLVALVVFLGAGYMAGTPARPMLPVFGQDAAKRVSPGAVLKEENHFLCGDVELVLQALAPADIVGEDIRGIRSRYPEKEGWTVGLENEKLVIIRKSVDGFCGEHSLYRHLGIHRDRLAVYQGPLGFSQRLLRVEDIMVESLPANLREKLLKARDFDKLPAADREALRSDLEFPDDNSLNSALENLDEVTE